jgi:hypothetical protein
VTLPVTLRARPEHALKPNSRNSEQNRTRRDGRVVDGGGLENHCTRKGTGGSNPSLSASFDGVGW